MGAGAARPMSDGIPLEPSFFARDTAAVARDLLGKVLVSHCEEGDVSGRIVETEAYLGKGDPGSHASTKGVTARNAVMYGPPATSYVYFTYGMHHMLNLVTEEEGTAGAVLLRALEPLMGTELMRTRRGAKDEVDLANGPGKVAQALGVDLGQNALRLGEGMLAVLDAPAPSERVGVSGRIGLTAGDDLPLRFYLEDNRYVSRGRSGRKGGSHAKQGK
jgi:DNA-3-methyladenine glycosylase